MHYEKHSSAAQPQHTLHSINNTATQFPSHGLGEPWHMVKTLAKFAAWWDRTRDPRVGSELLNHMPIFIIYCYETICIKL